jgi:hypothetical protein
MARKQRYTSEQVQNTLVACNGLVYLAAERLGCASTTICNYMNRYPSIRRVVLEKRGKRVDVAEAALDKAVLAGEAWAVQFLLKTQAKDRGYVERQEVTGADGAAIKVRVLTDEQRLAAMQKLVERVRARGIRPPGERPGESNGHAAG